jgi:DNA polymerase III subunit delta'
MTVWDALVGQKRAIAELSRAAEAAAKNLRGEQAAGMTHAWLFTGPPGSGRSVAALAFAAALQCPRGGCGECEVCLSVRRGTYLDVQLVTTEKLSIGVDEVRELVRRATLSPQLGRWQVIVIEDADRLNERAWDVLLKSVEEPAVRTVWMLCAPGAEEVAPTIRSRCRHVLLRTPSTRAVAAGLVSRDGIDPAMAAFAARASQGHIGRARRLATDEDARLRRAEVLRLPLELGDIGGCLAAAANLVDAATEDAKRMAEERDARESVQLSRALGIGAGGRKPPGAEGALKGLEKDQKRRYTRTLRDSLDRALVDLASFYRDVLAVQVGAGVELTNDELRPAVVKVATASSPESTLRRIEAVLACREAVDANVAPLLAAEAMTLALRAG